MNQFYSLKDAAALLRVQPYKIVYLLTTGQVKEPQRIGGKRIFKISDLRMLAQKMGITHSKDQFDQKAGSHDD